MNALIEVAEARGRIPGRLAEASGGQPHDGVWIRQLSGRQGETRGAVSAHGRVIRVTEQAWMRRLAVLVFALSLIGMGPVARAATDAPAAASAGANEAVLNEVWQTVRDHFYDPTLRGLDWASVRARYAPRAAAAESEDGLAATINAMLAELHASHTEFYTPADPAYYQLADIFAGALRRRGLDGVFPGGKITYPGIGIFARPDAAGRVFVTGVIDDAPAQHAGLLVGDEIVAVDGESFRPVLSFRNKVGRPVALSIRRHAEGAVELMTVTPTELQPREAFLQGLRASARLIPARNGLRIGYVHIWSYAGGAYQEALEQLLGEGMLKDADALVLDLREGWGGAVPDYLDLFNARAPTMQVRDRNGHIQLDNVKWRRPVAMLVNERSRSGKEVLAYGFKKYRLGEVIGSRTSGAVLAASAFLMRNGDLLLLAVDDVRVDGEWLEGTGVEPTIAVPFDSRYAAGSDPQLDRAIEVLSQG
jgi:carboxyl-terminal processing protease